MREDQLDAATISITLLDSWHTLIARNAESTVRHCKYTGGKEA